ncbi:hypothetical protein MTR_5g039560 [Medicago truncatula]|uniref:Uncharacterized protein n=1 Tax=Medicago truncatula TaxID=3880 RepID=G7KCI9_MEDTR|nr:hypothetical protein MTR_5g039560 [Medicago truncatula]
MSLCPEPSSPSSVYLPPLLDSSPYTAASIATFNGDQMCNSNNTDLKEHVSCFSTTSTTSNVVAAHNNFSNNNNGSFDLVSPSMNATIDPFASLIPTEAKLDEEEGSGRWSWGLEEFRGGGFGRDGGGSVVVRVCVSAATEIAKFGGGHGGGLNDDDEDIFSFLFFLFKYYTSGFLNKNKWENTHVAYTYLDNIGAMGRQEGVFVIILASRYNNGNHGNLF